MFDDLAGFLPGFIDAVLAQQAGAGRHCPIWPGPFPVEKQRALGARADGARSASTSSMAGSTSATHPFCGGVPDDVRITTRYDEGDFASGLMGVLHETGHALYERGLPRRLAAPAGRPGARHEPA